jgi:hypothetical protein
MWDLLSLQSRTKSVFHELKTYNKLLRATACLMLLFAWSEGTTSKLVQANMLGASASAGPFYADQ